MDFSSWQPNHSSATQTVGRKRMCIASRSNRKSRARIQYIPPKRNGTTWKRFRQNGETLAKAWSQFIKQRIINLPTPNTNLFVCRAFFVTEFLGCKKGCKSHNSLIYTHVCGKRGIKTIIQNHLTSLSNNIKTSWKSTPCWYVLKIYCFLDNDSSNNPHQKVGQAVGQE